MQDEVRPWRPPPNSPLQPGLLDGVEVQSGDLVLVLVGHQLEEVPRHRLGQLGVPRSALLLGHLYAADELGVAAGPGLVLVGHELGDARLHEAA